MGGMGSMIGSLIGAGAMIVVSEYLRALQEYNLLVYGFVLLLILIFAPDGLYGFVTWFKKIGGGIFFRTRASRGRRNGLPTSAE